ncbi:GxxExxY protein [Prevotella sp. HUN102]|uniref:GxxExxY protein n=1 Tax=Prevotella sp. HUN102 TaxID=1392486 RepID=UPI001E4A5A5F|nr:GxxExxY protein [Prevotella sp. HUN102]
MRVHREYRYGLLENAYEVALKYLLEQKGYTVERQVFLPIFWKEVKLDQSYRMDLVVNGNIIVELKAIAHIDTPHRRQLWNYLNLTHLPYGMLINFSPTGLYSEWLPIFRAGVLFSAIAADCAIIRVSSLRYSSQKGSVFVSQSTYLSFPP